MYKIKAIIPYVAINENLSAGCLATFSKLQEFYAEKQSVIFAFQI